MIWYDFYSSITIDCDAKRIVVRENALSHLMELLDDKNELVQLNAIKVIINYPACLIICT